MVDTETRQNVSQDNYASTLADVKNHYEAKIAELEEARARDLKEYANQLVNGQTVEKVDAEVIPTEQEISELRRKLFDVEHPLTNLEFMETTLELRNALMAKGEPDPFIPDSHKYSPTDEDIRIAQKCAAVYEECIEFAEGDSEVFTNELMRRTKDVRR